MLVEGYPHKKIKELCKLAKGQLIGKYGIAIIASLLVLVIEMTLTLISNASTMTATVMSYLISIVIAVIIDLLIGVLVFGQNNFFLQIARGEIPKISEIFRGLKGLTDKAILVQCVFTGFSFLSLIPTILVHFGLIYVPADKVLLVTYGSMLLQYFLLFLAKLYFGLSFYLLADHPEWSVPEIFKESLSLMKGKKGRLLLIYLRCVPVMLLSLLACGIGTFFYMAYYQTLIANFYLDTIGEEGWTPKPEKNEPYPPTQSDSTDSSTLDIRL